MDSLLVKARPDDIQLDPFPHIVIRDAMDPALYARLAGTMPPWEKIGWAGPPPDNKRYPLAASRILADPAIDPAWKEFCRCHTSAGFLGEVAALFGDILAATHPVLESRLGPLGQARTGLLDVDRYPAAEVLLDARLEINTPVASRPCSVRRGHIDLPNRLFSGLFYMRHPEDRTPGGELEHDFFG